ncbi:phosphodiester glycosidase family protein [Psychrobacter jeotgali]|uniref:phosphodiester glycosidase family protein n=1 Tax=Psychrobacter jeotgali TaxID=179010 RepID=UPI001D1009C9|nr:phosphodiester glycosidase family protein [Psychrobacter jeotgali]
MTGIAVLSLALSACQPTPSNTTDAMAQEWSCQTLDSPFSYDVCGVDTQVLAGDDYSLRLFWQSSENAKTLLTFDNLLNSLSEPQTLAFAMNAGMYNERYAPIGYTVIEGEEIRALNLNEGGGNFHLSPNGVMWWDKENNVQISESNALSAQLKNGEAEPWYATQSGPMLVIDGAIHPKFNPDSSSLKFRNGVGVCDDGRLQFVNSNQPVSFYQFASLFKDDLSCPNALFLDGGIASALYAPSIDKHDKKEMGVIIGLVKTKK